MTPVFADAGYWIGLFDPHDDLHAQALAVSKKLRKRQIVTSQPVLTEFLNHFASMGQSFRRVSVEVVRTLQQDAGVTIVAQTDEQFEAALSFYSQRTDKEWGPVDCASFLIMQQRGLTEALAHDSHFAQAGFIRLLRLD